MAVWRIEGGFVIDKVGKGRMGFFGDPGTADGDSLRFSPLVDDPADDQKGGERNDKNGLYQGLNPVVSDLKMGLLQPHAEGLADLRDGGIGLFFGQRQ